MKQTILVVTLFIIVFGVGWLKHVSPKCIAYIEKIMNSHFSILYSYLTTMDTGVDPNKCYEKVFVYQGLSRKKFPYFCIKTTDVMWV